MLADINISTFSHIYVLCQTNLPYVFIEISVLRFPEFKKVVLEMSPVQHIMNIRFYFGM